MSRTFDLATGPNYSINSVGSLGSLGNGAYTIIVLFNINTGNNNCGLISFRTAGINAELFIDGNQIFGAGDFGGGQTGVTVSTWWWAAIRKAAGSSVYTYSLKPYASGSATHQNSAASHADSGATNTTIRLGDSDDRGNGLIAVLAAWTSRLSDAQVSGMFTSAASDIAAQSPGGLWLGNQASSTDPINDSVGTANQTSVNGAIGVGSDPPAYNYSLGGATGVWLPTQRTRVRPQPPRSRPRIATPVRAQVNPPFPFTGIKQPRRLRGLLPRRPRTSTPIPAQIVAPAAPAYPLQAVRSRLRGLLRRRPAAISPPIEQLRPVGGATGRRKPPPPPPRSRIRTDNPVPAQMIAPTNPAYPLQSIRVRVRGLLRRRPTTAAPAPAQQVAPPAAPAYAPLAVRARLRFARLFRGRQVTPPAPQLAAPPTPRPRPHNAPPRRGRSFGPVPPQAPPPVPPAYPVRPSRSRIRGIKRFFGRSAMPIPPQQEITPPPPPPVPTPPTGSWWSLVSILREDRVKAREAPPLTCPHDGEPLKLSIDGYWYCQFDNYRLGDVPMRRHVTGQDWGGLGGVINTVIADATADAGRLTIACPRCGEPLSRSKDDVTFCRYDGYRPDGGQMPPNPGT